MFHVTILIKLQTLFTTSTFIVLPTLKHLIKRVLVDWAQDYALNIPKDESNAESTTEEMNYDGMGVNYDSSEDIEEVAEDKEEKNTDDDNEGDTDDKKENEEGSASGDGDGENGLGMLAKLEGKEAEDEEEEDMKIYE